MRMATGRGIAFEVRRRRYITTRAHSDSWRSESGLWKCLQKKCRVCAAYDTAIGTKENGAKSVGSSRKTKCLSASDREIKGITKNFLHTSLEADSFVSALIGNHMLRIYKNANHLFDLVIKCQIAITWLHKSLTFFAITLASPSFSEFDHNNGRNGSTRLFLLS